MFIRLATVSWPRLFRVNWRRECRSAFLCLYLFLNLLDLFQIIILCLFLFLIIFLLNWPIPASFSFIFCPYLIAITVSISISTSTIWIEESIDGLLWIWTWGRRMVGADETTKLWRTPYFWLSYSLYFTSVSFTLVSISLYRSIFLSLFLYFYY